MSTNSFIVPMDGAPFTVGIQQNVRITGEGVAGAKIIADVRRPRGSGGRELGVRTVDAEIRCSASTSWSS